MQCSNVVERKGAKEYRHRHSPLSQMLIVTLLVSVVSIVSIVAFVSIVSIVSIVVLWRLWRLWRLCRLWRFSLNAKMSTSFGEASSYDYD
jgi:hypothetical protein